jgi:hypothetical protein
MTSSTPVAARSETPTKTPLVAALLAWLIPGAGHYYLGRRGRALAFCALVLSSAAIGILLEGRLFVALPSQPLTRLGALASMGMGIPYFVLRYLVDYAGDLRSAAYEYGTAFLLTAGLMNLLVLLDAWDIARGDKP